MTILYLSLAWLVGIWLASSVDLPANRWLSAGILFLLLAFLARYRPRLRLALAVLALASLGGARYAASIPQFDGTHVASYNDQGTVILSGLVAAEPTIGDRSISLRLQSQNLLLADGRRLPVEGLVLIRAPRLPEISYGSHLLASGVLEEPASDPGFDYKAYLARLGIYSQMSWPELTVLSEGGGNAIMRSLLTFKEEAQGVILSQLPDPQASLLAGILLGDDSGLSSEMNELFRASGLSHIIAISGFNIAILAGLLLVASRPFLGRRRSAWFVLVGVTVYTVLVGAQASVIRAAIMVGLYVVAYYLMGRPTFAPAGLANAALLMTILDPRALWDIGFQLSFAATLGLMLYLGPWSRWSERRLSQIFTPDKAGRIARILAEIGLATLAASLLTLPIIALHFGQISLVSPLANLFVLPAQPGVMIWGGLSTLIGLVFPAAGQLLAWIAWLFLTYTVGLVRFFGSLPYASVPISVSPAGVVATYAFILCLTWLLRQPSEQRQRFTARVDISRVQYLTLGAGAIAALLLFAWSFSRPDGRLHIFFFDVGQGDATFIQTPSGRQILVDGGPASSVLSEQLGRQIPFWDRDIDLVIATHPDADHVGALSALFDRYRVGRLITNGQSSGEASYRALLAAAADHKTAIHHTLAGEVIAIGDGVRLEFLNPTSNPVAAADRASDNERSVVVRLAYGDFTLLLTGDTGEAAEATMLAAGRPLSALVLKAGHHGANGSSTWPFLEAVRPQYVVISAGAGNRFGHPHPEMLQRAADVGAAVLRTDELGTIEVISDGEVMWWESQS